MKKIAFISMLSFAIISNFVFADVGYIYENENDLNEEIKSALILELNRSKIDCYINDMKYHEMYSNRLKDKITNNLSLKSTKVEVKKDLAQPVISTFTQFEPQSFMNLEFTTTDDLKNLISFKIYSYYLHTEKINVGTQVEPNFEYKVKTYVQYDGKCKVSKRSF